MRCRNTIESQLELPQRLPKRKHALDPKVSKFVQIDHVVAIDLTAILL